MRYLYVYGHLGSQLRLCGMLPASATKEVISAACADVFSRGYTHPMVTPWAGDNVRSERQS